MCGIGRSGQPPGKLEAGGWKLEASSDGVTLLELVVVLSLLSLFLGIGVGAMASLSVERPAALSQIRNIIRTTRSFAVAQGSPATLVVRAAAGEVFGVGLKTVGQWHFEDAQTTGAFGYRGTIHGAVLDRSGRYGSCLAFEGEGHVDCGKPPVFDVVEGVAIEAWVRTREGGVVAAKGGLYGLSVEQDRTVRGWVRAKEQDPTGRWVPAELLEVTSGEHRVPEDRWCALRFLHDGDSLRVFLDEIERGSARLKERRLVWSDPTIPFTVSSPENPFGGRIDEVRLSAVVRGEPVSLPEGYRIEGNDRWVRFDRTGHLDPLHHDGPVEITVVLPEGGSETLRIGVLGVVR